MIKVLTVDDSRTMRDMLRLALAGQGFTVTQAVDGEQGLEVLNESVSPAEDITAEILAEGVDHQFFFQVNGADLVISYGDADTNGDPIGLLSACFAGMAGSGSLKVTLRHMPDKTAAGVAVGDITNAGGDTDIEVTFPLIID